MSDETLAAIFFVCGMVTGWLFTTMGVVNDCEKLGMFRETGKVFICEVKK